MLTTIFILLAIIVALLYILGRARIENRELKCGNDCMIQTLGDQCTTYAHKMNSNGLSGYGELKVDAELIDLLDRRDHLRTINLKDTVKEEIGLIEIDLSARLLKTRDYTGSRN